MTVFMEIQLEIRNLRQMAICKSRNEKSGNGMRGMMETRGIRVGKRGIRV